MELKMRINTAISSAQILGVFDVNDESKIRFIVEGAGPSNVIQIRARLLGQPSFTLLDTINGSENKVINVFTYEELQIECTTFDATGEEIRIYSASFNEAGGSAIDFIGVPSGSNLTDFNSFSFDSSDSSISITGDNVTKTIDLIANVGVATYIPDNPADWSPAPTTVSEGLDQLAERVTDIETTKIDSTEKGAADGVAPLNSLSKIDSAYLPSYVDDVEEYANLASFPPIGESSKIYIALDTNKTYRWATTVYVEISPSAVASVNGQTGIVILDKTDIGLGNVDNTSDLDKIISNATQAALDAIDDKFDASTYYHELHVNFDYTGIISDGSPYTPFKTLQSAVTAAQAQTIGANTAILVHLKNDTVVNENIVISNMPRNLYIQSANTNNNDSSPIKINGSLTISGATTTRVRVKDLQFSNTTGYALIIDDTNGRHMFQNCQFSNGGVPGLANTGVNFINTYRNFTEFSDCTIEGTVNIDGTPVAGATVSFYRCRLGFSNLIVNSPNISVGLYDTYGLYGLTHTNGALAITGMWGVTSFFNSTANLSATNFLSLSNVSLQKFDLSFVPLNKTGTCFYQLMTVHRGETADVLNGTRTVYGPTSTDAAYKMGVSGNWSPAVTNVAGALDQLAANKVAKAGDSMTGQLTMTDASILIDHSITQGFTAFTELNGTSVFLQTNDGVNSKELNQNSSTSTLNRTNVSSLTSDTTLILSVEEGAQYLLAETTDYANDTFSQTTLNSQNFGINFSDNISGVSSTVIFGAGSYAIQTTQPDSSYVLIEGSNTGTTATQYDGVDTTPLMPTLPEHYTVKEYVDNLVGSGETGILERFEVMKEPTGFVNRTSSVTSFNSSLREFTIAPVGDSYEVYVQANKYVKTTAETIVLDNLSGNHYIYFDIDGNLASTQVANSDLFQNNALISIIYWNSDTSSHTYFAEERHGLTMDGTTHSYLHTVFGARYLSGLALQNFVVDGDGSLATHAQFTSDSGSIRDEDLLITLSAQTQIPVLYRQGQLWRKKAADSFPVIYSGTAGYTGASGLLPFNEFTGGSWQLTEIANNGFVLVHVFGTNDKETPVVAIQGIATYGNVTAARLAASSELTSLTGLPFAEFVALGSVVFESANAYTNTPKAIVRSVNGGDYVDFRGTQLYTPAGEPTTHSLLSNLSSDDHLQYHTDDRGDIRYYTKTQIDNDVIKKAGTTAFTGDQSMGGNKLTFLANPVALTDAVNLQTLNAAIGSTGDIFEKSFSLSNNQSVAANITDFVFANGTVRSFEALVSVSISATTNLYETFEIKGIQKDSDWFISISAEGDNSNVILSITSSGQFQYTTPNYFGFVSGVLKFRAITTSV